MFPFWFKFAKKKEKKRNQKNNRKQKDIFSPKDFNIAAEFNRFEFV